MSFLSPETNVGTWIEVLHTHGEGSWIPYDAIGGDPDSYTPEDVLEYTNASTLEDVEEIIVHRNMIGVRLSASGYMDCTDWSVSSSIEDAREALADMLDMGEGTDEDGRDVEDVAKEELPDDEERVRVLFYRQRAGADWGRAPIAVFPDMEENPGYVRSYMRVGQHGGADLEYLQGPDFEETCDDDEDTRALADELERIGYTFARSRTVWTSDMDEPGGDEPGGDEPGGDEPGGDEPDLNRHGLLGRTPAEDAPPRLSEGTLRAYFLGVSEGRVGLSTGVTFDDDPESERSVAYDTGRNLGERRKLAEDMADLRTMRTVRDTSGCPECERGMGDDYTDGCDECAMLEEEKRACDLSAELEDVGRELATALTARSEAHVELDKVRMLPGSIRRRRKMEAQDRVDMLDERVRELEARSVELETKLAELDVETPEEDEETKPGDAPALDPIQGTGITFHVHEIPYGAPGLCEEERLTRFAYRALQLVDSSEKRRAEAEARGEHLPLDFGDYLALAAARWGLHPATEIKRVVGNAAEALGGSEND